MAHPLTLLRELYDLSSTDIEEIASLLEEQHYTKGTILTRQHRILHQGIYIKKGGARVYFVEKGKEHTTSFAFDDEYLPTRLAMSSGSTPSTDLFVMFIEDTDVIFLPKNKIIEVLATAPPETQVKVLKFVNATVAQISAILENRIYHLLHSSAEERYHWAINSYPRLLQSATTSQIASFIGLSRETITRIRSGRYSR